MRSHKLRIGLVLAAAVAFTQCKVSAADTLQTVVVHAPKADLALEVARTQAQREHGLMNRTQIRRHTGMIFVFERDEPVEFWMKDTLVPLDMIFVAADGTVRGVTARVPTIDPSLADEKIPREPGQGKYVIELAAGEAAEDGLAPGVRLDLRGVPPAQ